MASTAIEAPAIPLLRYKAVQVLGVSMALGLAANLLLRVPVWGLGFPIFVAICLLVGWRMWRSSVHPMSISAAWMALPMMVFALCLAWRDSTLLRDLNLFAFFLCLAILVSRIRLGAIGKLTFLELLTGWLAQVGAATFEFFFLVFKDVPWNHLGSPAARQKTGIAMRGVLIAVPILIVFGALLSSADAVFSNYLSQAFNWDAAAIFENALGTVIGAWAVGSIFRRLFLAPEPVTSAEIWNTALGSPSPAQAIPPPYLPHMAPAPKKPMQPGIGNVEVAIALGSLILLLGAFAAVQIRFLFVGAPAMPAGISYSNYARNGFFQLLAVIALAVPVLRLTHYGLKKRGANGWTYPTLAGIVVGLLGIVAASAFRRLGLCIDAWGLSEIRLYGGAVMAWLAVCLGWLLVTIYTRKNQAFVIGAILSGFLTILSLNALNPDALIAQTNMDRATKGKGLDSAYLASLSADAKPTINQNLASLPKPSQAALKEKLSQKQPASSDWREWNLSRMQAALSDGN